MRIAVVGNGNMGSGFATALERAGHEVSVGSRRGVAYADAVRDADVVIVAVPGTALLVFLLHGPAPSAGRPIGPRPSRYEFW